MAPSRGTAGRLGRVHEDVSGGAVEDGERGAGVRA
jgi:hypothetical protein